MSRDAMRQMKATYEEAERIERIKQVINHVYQTAVQTAKSSFATSYNHPVPQQHRIQTDPFYLKNMPDILVGLQELFPGCAVSHTLLSKGTDGKMYDISKLDDKVLPFVNRALDQSYIVVDWS